MHERLASRLLNRIMNWNEETATREYAWLRLIARLKFDGYRDYLAGVRFAESLAGWLSQFEPSHREAAYAFVKTRLIYYSPPCRRSNSACSPIHAARCPASGSLPDAVG
jgi:hypothetical protein